MTKKTLWPNWMKSDPRPVEESRSFSGITIEGWQGFVPLKEISYWIDNRRTDVQISRLKKKTVAVPSNDQLYEYFVNDPELGIESLARNIVLNGLREPLVLANDRTLLDGNRRYLAHRWISMNIKPPEKERFENVRVWVLKEKYSDERNKLRIVAEYNFLDNFKKKWKDYVRAKLLYDEYNNSNKSYTYNDLVNLYGGPGFGYGKIVEFIKTFEVIVEYVHSAPDEDIAWAVAEENFIWFQQLQRSYRDEIRNDDEFQKAVFENITQGYIGTTNDLKNLKEMRKSKEAWSEFKRGDVRESHVELQRILLEKDKEANPELDLGDINNRLDSLLEQEGAIGKVSTESRNRFHQLAEQVPGKVNDVNLRINYIIERLDGITSSELENLSQPSLRKLIKALERVITQAKSTKP